MTRALLITNPVAARTEAQAVTAVRDTLRRGGWRIELLATMKCGDARRFAREAWDQGFDAVVCYGGDGTAMQAAAGLVGSEIPLGLVPGGTGNLLAGNLRLPRRPAAAARAILRGVALPVDLGEVVREDGPQFFAVACGAGFDAELMAQTAQAAKQRWRMAAYVLRALETLPQVNSVAHHVTVDGTTHERTAAMVLVANCGELMPPFLRLRRGVTPDDGWLDVLALRADGAMDAIVAFLELLRGDGSGDHVWFARGRTISVAVAADPQRPVQLDGEPAGETPFTARLIPGALRVLVDPETVPGGRRDDG